MRKLIATLFIVAVLSQGCAAAPAPGIVGFFFDGIGNIFNAVSSAFSNMLAPQAMIKESVDRLSGTLQSTLTTLTAVPEKIITRTAEVMNRITENANQMVAHVGSRGVAQSLLDALNFGIQRVQIRVARTVDLITRIATGIVDVMTLPLNLFNARLDDCNWKLTTLLFTGPSGVVKTYQNNVTTALNNMNQAIATNSKAMTDDLSTFYTEQILIGSEVYNGLLSEINAVLDTYEDKELGEVCLADGRAFTEAIVEMVSNAADQFAQETDDAVAEYAASMQERMKQMTTTAAEKPKPVCVCVETVNPLNFLERGKANSCATTAAKTLNSEAVTKEAKAIAEEYKNELATIAEQTKAGMSESMATLPELAEWIKADFIKTC